MTMLCGAAAAQPAGMAGDVSALNSATKDKVPWNVAAAKSGDVTCDGRPDRILIGTDRKSVWVGVVSGSDGKAQVTKFAVTAGVATGFCSVPTTIKLYQHDCYGAEGSRLDDCKVVKACRDFVVADAGECDGFHFYWSSTQTKMNWWRNS
jgi:hypothetical protein